MMPAYARRAILVIYSLKIAALIGILCLMDYRHATDPRYRTYAAESQAPPVDPKSALPDAFQPFKMPETIGCAADEVAVMVSLNSSGVPMWACVKKSAIPPIPKCASLEDPECWRKDRP